MSPTPPSPPDSAGRGAALLVYALYLLSIPSAGIFALIGVIVALSARADAGAFARGHLDHAIRIWMTAFWWAIGLGLLWFVGFLLIWILVGFLIWAIGAALAFLVMLWFTVKSALGLLALLDGRPR